jgi:hypothetical protein
MYLEALASSETFKGMLEARASRYICYPNKNSISSLVNSFTNPS